MTHEVTQEIVAEAEIDVKAERAAFHRGFVALKKHLAAQVAEQVLLKRVLRMPRKTSEDRAKLEEVKAVTKIGRLYPGRVDISDIQSRAATRARDITAILHVHAEVRGMPAMQNPGKFCATYFADAKKKARAVFENAARAEE